jgi:beta-lactamase regulating signal transducer with metallopeptidase domain
MVFGWRHPVILLPSQIDQVLPPVQLRGILTHELAHVRRQDFAMNLAQIGLDIVLWFHPAARWVSRQVRAEREFCCDDIALASGAETSTYAHALAALDDARDEGRLAIAAASGTLLDRLERMAGRPRRLLSPATGACVALAALTISAAAFAAALMIPPDVALDAQLRQRSPGPTVPPVGDPAGPRTR